MSQNLSSAAVVIGALRVKSMKVPTISIMCVILNSAMSSGSMAVKSISQKSLMIPSTSTLAGTVNMSVQFEVHRLMIAAVIFSFISIFVNCNK